ncbi:MAG: TSUP family transporter, partial [Pseudomonadota bacterium]
MESETLWGLMAVTFLAAFIQSSTGFGFGLVAVPAFLILLDSLSAVPIISALTVLVGVIVIPPLIKHTPVKLLSVALAAMVVGVPVGLLFYAYADVATAKVVTGVIIVVLASMLVLRDLGLRVRWPWGTAEGRAGVGGLNAGSTGDASVAGVAVPS